MKITRNEFYQGRNTDTDPTKIGPTQYRSAYNVELVGDANFAGLRDIKGTTELATIVSDTDVVELGTFPVKFTIDGTKRDCLLIFTAKEGGNFVIYAHRLDTSVTYTVYTEPCPDDYLTSDRSVDARLYPENDEDVVYFTDNYFEPRFIRCVLDSPYTPLSSYDISMLKKAANGKITIASGDGGSLLSGSYQFAYRMVNPTKKQFTKWSTLTNPGHAYLTSTISGVTVKNSGVGLVTGKKLDLTVYPTAAELDNFDFYQLAVVENVGVEAPTTASLLEITSIAGLSFEYTTNARIGTISLNDIVVDLAQIETFKTLNIRDNRLIGANITYTQLEFDNGVPEVTSGEILTKDFIVNNPYATEDNATNFLGYWRNEVYRFCAIFTDENGNKRIQPLDLDNKITGNQIASGLPDVKFPDRSVAGYSIFGPSGIRALGLTLNGLTNIPSWAKSVEIGVVRKKDILFQSPLVPMTVVQGIGAVSEYPTINFNGITDSSIDSAQPQTTDKILVPKNLFWPELREISARGERNTVVFNVGLATEAEAKIKRKSDYNFAALFPPDAVYGKGYEYIGSEKMDVVDYSLLKVRYVDYSPTNQTGTNALKIGDFLTTSVSGNFYAINESQYFFDNSTTGKSIPSTRKNISIDDYEAFTNFGQPASVSGFSTLDYEALKTKNIGFWQTTPAVQKMAVVKMGTFLNESSLTFKAATYNAPNDGTPITSAYSVNYENSATLTNNYFVAYPGYTQDAYISTLPIVNVKLGLGDDRYGDITADHEFRSTGAKYVFDAAEIATLEAGGDLSIDIDVWGGDCFIGSHFFKVADSAYSVVNQGKNHVPLAYDSRETTVKKWERMFLYDIGGTDPIISLPVAVEDAGQYVQLILESEYNGDVLNKDVIGVGTSASGVPIFTTSSKEAIKTPLTYLYNTNLSILNSQKVYHPKPKYGFEQTKFNSRLVWTDVKIYNSDQTGFDTIRVADFYDIDENRRPIVKLASTADALYAIHENGVTYVPVGERQLEQSDASTIAVRTGDVIGSPLIVSTTRGSSHPRAIVETGDLVFIPDNFNKSVYVLSGRELQPIVENNETEFRSFFASTLDPNELMGIYDPIKRQYWLCNVTTGDCQVFNEKGYWEQVIEAVGIKSGVFQKQLYLLSEGLDLHSAYTNNDCEIFGTAVEPRVTFIINPDSEFSKTFENILVVSSNRLNTLDLITEKDGATQTVSGIDLDVPHIEGNYRIKVLRDSGGSKLRGLYTTATVTWSTIKSTLRSVATKYLLTARTPW